MLPSLRSGLCFPSEWSVVSNLESDEPSIGKKKKKEQTNLTVKQMVIWGDEVKGWVIIENWRILK